MRNESVDLWANGEGEKQDVFRVENKQFNLKEVEVKMNENEIKNDDRRNEIKLIFSLFSPLFSILPRLLLHRRPSTTSPVAVEGPPSSRCSRVGRLHTTHSTQLFAVFNI